MEKITSTTNEKVKQTAKLQQKKYREETGLFLIEGEKALEGAIKAGFEIELVYKNGKYSVKDIPENKIVETNEAVFSKISTTKTPCKIAAVAKQKKYEMKEFTDKKRLVLLENIKDAGNLGTILRACKAFDIDGVLLLGDTIDLYNPKVIRASVGCFDIPVINVDYDEISLFKNHKIYSTALYKDSKPLKSIKFETPFIIAFGSEADGLTNKFLMKTTENIKIETSTNVESLNLSIAVSICLYESFTK